MFAPNWTVRGEYRYARYGSDKTLLFKSNPIDAIRVRTDQSSHTMILGFSYLFN
jgi:opacity protein-like surface antigen